MTSVTASVRIVIFLFSAFMVTSCGVIRTSAPSNVPDVSPLSTDELEELIEIQSGTASWYGPNFHGKLTANGETFNMNDLTAAHRTLPFNTIVQVENLTNGRSVVVRINDR
ncbi:MAG: septal ring lytic transglycosylase RlpA family protein, partial [Balneolaceae bacterium]|nr:septal ring lytic transglycosylase RlpA family protein [Balneolaceae bacterium]